MPYFRFEVSSSNYTLITVLLPTLQKYNQQMKQTILKVPKMVIITFKDKINAKKNQELTYAEFL